MGFSPGDATWRSPAGARKGLHSPRVHFNMPCFGKPHSPEGERRADPRPVATAWCRVRGGLRSAQAGGQRVINHFLLFMCVPVGSWPPGRRANKGAHCCVRCLCCCVFPCSFACSCFANFHGILILVEDMICLDRVDDYFFYHPIFRQ